MFSLQTPILKYKIPPLRYRGIQHKANAKSVICHMKPLAMHPSTCMHNGMLILMDDDLWIGKLNLI